MIPLDDEPVRPALQKALEIVNCLLQNETTFRQIFQKLVNLFCDSEENIDAALWVNDARKHLGLRNPPKRILLDPAISNGQHFVEANQSKHTIYINSAWGYAGPLQNEGEHVARSDRKVWFLVCKLLREVSHLLTKTFNAVSQAVHAQPKKTDWTTPPRVGKVFYREEIKTEGSQKRKRSVWKEKGDCGSGLEDTLYGGRIKLQERGVLGSYFQI